MKYILGVFFFATIFSVNTNAQTTTTVAKPQKFMLITTIESVIEGGLGRSRMLITKEDGSQEDKKMDNLFSLVGINFGNIKANDILVTTTIKTYTDAGWKIMSITPLSSGGGVGIFMTRYLMVKDM
jgi:hypothetical protein